MFEQLLREVSAANYIDREIEIVEMAFAKKNVEEFGEWLKREGFENSTVEIFARK